jgi:hypothetical protein
MIEYHKQIKINSRRECIAIAISLNPNFIIELIAAKENE